MGLEVFTIERVRELYEAARELFPEGSPGIRMKLSDGTLAGVSRPLLIALS